MRKSTKLAILVAALVALCSIAALAADTWKQEGDQWFCYDKDGNPYYGEWKKSGANQYYLDDATGAMVTDALVEYNGSKYWCGSDGAKVLGAWVQVPVENDDDGWEWMYFQTMTGKAVIGATQSIKGADGVSKKYTFNDEGYMLYGYRDDKGDKVDNVVEAVYYYGPKDEGWQRSEWQKFVDGELAEYVDGDKEVNYEVELLYFYFKNSKKVTSASYDEDATNFKVSTGKFYEFDKYGAMKYGWQKTASGQSYYLGAADDGLMKKKVWVKNDKVDIKEGWTYLDGNGKPVAADAGTVGQIKKVNGKYYLFNEAGRMISGIAVLVNKDDVDPLEAKEQIAIDVDKKGQPVYAFASVADFKKFDLDYAGFQRIYYFSTDEDTDGAMKTGTQTVVIDDEEVTVYFDKHGYANEGKISNKIYNNGVLQAAGDAKYAVVECKLEYDEGAKKGSYYLVNASGSIAKQDNKYMDADANWWVYNKKGIYKFADREYASKAANAWKNGESTFDANGKTYTISVKAEKEGYTELKWE